jgi:hypothetical protein
MRLLPRLLYLSGSIAFLLSAALGSVCYAQRPDQVASAQDSIQLPARWDEPVGRLADKIVAAVKPAKTVSFELRNISSIDAETTANIRRALGEHLAAHRLRIEPAASATCDIQTTLSETGRDYVWVAEVKCGDGQQVVMGSLPKGNRGVLVGNDVTLTVQRNLSKTQDAPFLDFAKYDLPGWPESFWKILEPGELIGYAGRIRQVHVSRDPRGRISMNKAHLVEAHVGEIRCISAVGTFIECGDPESSQEWTFENWLESPYVVGRNYFAGFRSKTTDFHGKFPPFFSVATLVFDHDTHWISTELDGKARLYEWSVEPAATFSGWGDDIASVTTSCDSAWHVLVTGTGDWTQPDQIQVYDIKNHQAIANGAPLQFPGPILALWPAEDGKTARVVSRNLKTGMYEASIVSVSCGD